jgi:hypothetical protein
MNKKASKKNVAPIAVAPVQNENSNKLNVSKTAPMSLHRG